MALEASDVVFSYPTWQRSKQKLIPPWVLAEGVLSEATLTPFKYTYYYFIMHGMQFLFSLTLSAIVPCLIKLQLSYTCVP
jgi:hypothetical protein